MIYLDNAATTKPNDVFLDAYIEASKNMFFNPSAIYKEGVKAQQIIDKTKKIILGKLGVIDSFDNIIFTNSATAANNLVIQGAYKSNWKEVIISSGEHPSVYNVVQWLEAKGVKVHLISLQSNGQIDYNEFERFCSNNTSFISIMLASNETGAITNLSRICSIKREKCPKALLHTDAVQAFCKVPFSLASYPEIDFVTISAHKIGGAKGLGALYYKKLSLLKPITYGGGQEKGLNSGTQDVPSIYAFGKLLESIHINENLAHVTKLKETFLNEIGKNQLIKCNSNENCSPYVISLSFPLVNGETIVHALEDEQILISTGSACSSKKKGNRILSSMGLNDSSVVSSVRVSFSPENTVEEVAFAANKMVEVYNNLKQRMNINE